MNDSINPSDLLHNRILSNLPKDEYDRIFPHLENASLSLGKVLYEPGDTIQYIYFPLRATISLTAVMENGAEAEVGVIGREGILGLPVILGTDTVPLKAIVQVAGSGVRMRVSAFKEKIDECREFYRILLKYAQAFFVQVSITAACNRLHHLDGRLARWLLMCRDRSRSDNLQLTHEFISIMLGVRRAGVTEAAGKLQSEKLIHYTRGKVSITDAEGLKAVSCECYEIVKKEYERLLGANNYPASFVLNRTDS